MPNRSLGFCFIDILLVLYYSSQQQVMTVYNGEINFKDCCQGVSCRLKATCDIVFKFKEDT